MSDHNEQILSGNRHMGEVTPNLAGLSDALEHAREFAHATQMTDLIRFQFLIIVEELITNIVTHGHPAGGSVISYEFRHESAGVGISLRDGGIPFDPRSLQTDQTDDPHEEEGGWGWPLIFRWCDSLNYEHKDNTNILSLSLKVDGL